jgi:hypothetical protein
LSSRRSWSLLSRASFAIVVFFLPLEAMLVRPLLWIPSASRSSAGAALEGLVEPLRRACRQVVRSVAVLGALRCCCG